MCVTAYMHLSTKGSRRQPHIPCNWSYRQLVAIQCEHSDLNSSPLQEQWTLIFNKPISYKLFLIFQGVFIIINKVSVKPIRKKKQFTIKNSKYFVSFEDLQGKGKMVFFYDYMCVRECVYEGQKTRDRIKHKFPGLWEELSSHLVRPKWYIDTQRRCLLFMNLYYTTQNKIQLTYIVSV